MPGAPWLDPLDKLVLGIGGSAAIGAAAGLRFGKEDTPAGDRMKAGAAIGLGGYAAYRMGAFNPLMSAQAWKTGAERSYGAAKAGGKLAWAGADKVKNAAKWVYNSPMPVKLGITALASLGLFAAGSAMTPKGTNMAGMDDGQGGIDYVDPASINERRPGVGDRLRAMNAEGDVVLGMHHGRHAQ
jgi:hypothetical protein